MQSLDPEKKDDLEYERRGAALLLNRQRRDLLARISEVSIESFSYHYGDMERLNRLQERLKGTMDIPKDQRWGSFGIQWADGILLLSASGKGWRAKQVENVEKAHAMDGESIGDDIETSGRGLKHRGQE